jgi:hypothetical protein
MRHFPEKSLILPAGGTRNFLGLFSAALLRLKCLNLAQPSEAGNIRETMKLERAALAVAIIALAITAWCVAQNHNLQARLDSLSARPPMPQPSVPSLQPTNIEQRLSKLEAVTPDVGQTMLSIQFHFAKLYYAAEARNWDLARFEREEIVEDLDTVAALKPEENGVSLVGIIGAFTNSLSGPLSLMKDAMDVSDRPLFRKAYQDSMLMCNTCHQSTGRPFIVITTPTNPPVFNQRWEPAIYGAKSSAVLTNHPTFQ